MNAFKVDENLPIEAARLLMEAGHDVSTVIEQGLGGQADEVLAERCRQEKRVLITLDIGFADIRAYPPREFSGLIVLRLKRQDKGYVISVLSKLTELLDSEELQNRLWVVDEGRVRIRE